MNNWIGSFDFSTFGAAFLLCIMGLWFTIVIPGIDRWSKRFFMSYFFVFMLCCLSSIAEVLLQYYAVPRVVFIPLLILESLLLSLPLLMQTAYMLHYCDENLRRSRLLLAMLGLWAVYIVLLASVLFIDGFIYITPENQYSRGSLYPLPLIPIIAALLLHFAGMIRRRNLLPRRVFFAFLIAILPITVALSMQLFVDVFPLIDFSYVLSALAMYSLILSDQIEQDRRRQREIIKQQQEIAEQEREIARQQREIAQERTSVMVLQMRPHFIYNTLMSIHSLCRLDPRKAQQVTEDFTQYLRRNFNAVAGSNSISFSAELEHTRAYLAVEQVRYEEMLLVEYDTAFTQFRLPPLTLQPIAENAVKHGINPYSDPLSISIRTRHTDSGSRYPVTEIIVEDTGPGFDPSDEDKPHITLENIRQRLEMMCSGSMTIKPREGGGTVVTVTIPDSTERKEAVEER